MTDAEIRWFRVRLWERWLVTPYFFIALAIFPAGGTMSLRDPGWPLALAFLGATLFCYRLGRTCMLGIAVLPRHLMVKRALSLGVEHVKLQDVSNCVFQQHFAAGWIVVRFTSGWRPPCYLEMKRIPPSGFRPDDWRGLVSELRAVFQPLGKWEERPWWRPTWSL